MNTIGVKKYWMTVSFYLMFFLGTARFAPQLKAHAVADSHSETTIVELCNALAEAGSNRDFLQCLSKQSVSLNRAKNLARQRGEKDNGGVGSVATELSMHGPSAESPYQIVLCDDNSIEYIFTFRIRPRTSFDYTYESKVRVTHNSDKDSEWTVDTIYNYAIAPTTVSYSEQLEARAN